MNDIDIVKQVLSLIDVDVSVSDDMSRIDVDVHIGIDLPDCVQEWLRET